ncbi:hypothetical protein PCASD_15015 [Puccinia coronata f. sp. avenae]|uniref:Uncharacterized protein n=1 Tax=Puccinia coronata f. sp. avenae TaxID=200324 RepID=A0A2N5T9B6_9BASI|nr:hypothetical protein PCASD_15015 [Puccinia coronata f. sp. avenae]
MIRTLKPTPYDLLTHDKRVSLVLKRIKKQQEDKLDYKIAFNNLLRAHTATQRVRYLERMSNNATTNCTPFLTSSNSTTTTPLLRIDP